MNRFIMITNRQKLTILVLSVIFIIISAICISTLDFSKAVRTNNYPESEDAATTAAQNRNLNKILSSIIPSDNKALYEDNLRYAKKNKTIKTYPLKQPSQVQAGGKPLPYRILFTDEDYMRPIYSGSWKQSYYRGWLYLPRKIISARHTLFVYTGSAENITNIEGELGFSPNISIDTDNFINILVYNFDLQGAVQLKNQIVLSGIPVKKGVQLLAVRKKDINPSLIGYGNMTFQLCTPAGYEIDYQNLSLENKTSDIQNYGPDGESVWTPAQKSTDIKRQNKLLKQELAHYVSDAIHDIPFQYNGSYQTSDVLSANVDLEDAVRFSKALTHSTLYSNSKYISPAYHPTWKKHYNREWCYIPRKMYLNMKRIFVLPSNTSVANDLLGELGFFEKCPSIGKNQVGLLIKNFSVDSVSLYQDNILLSGIPSRAGVQLISLPKANLKKNRDFAVRLITKDKCEMDIDLLKN